MKEQFEKIMNDIFRKDISIERIIMLSGNKEIILEYMRQAWNACAEQVLKEFEFSDYGKQKINNLKIDKV